MTVITIIDFIREFDLIGERAVSQILGELDPVTIYAIFIVGALHNHVTIFCVGGVVEIFGIDAVHMHQRRLGNALPQFVELLEERFPRIIF